MAVDTSTASANLAAMRADWAAADARITDALDDMRARTAGVLAAPGLPSPTADLARVVTDLLVLLRAEIVTAAEDVAPGGAR